MVSGFTRNTSIRVRGTSWARRDVLRPTDALYVELAKQRNCPLLTTDHRLARGSPDAGVIAVS